ncbi:hypothetical protein WHY20_04420 [Clostridium perfringens]|uniref:hypothetical protein n=1 Tax=Clostridium perfringens TaxID=1502 RepID=UPI0030CDF2AD
MNEKVKFEVPQIQLSGKYKIQLFDKDTNELVEEVEKHNIISKIPFSVAFHNNIYRGFIANDSAVGLTGTTTGASDRWYSGYINWLMLTNDSEAPENDDKNPVVFGDMTGYARYKDNQSYSDVKRGIFNQNESTVLYNKHGNGTKIKSVTNHIVWDFPTDKGNGTFDNIYLVPNPDDNYNPDDYRGQSKFIDSIILANEGNYNYRDDYHYQGDLGPISNSDTHLYMQCLYYKDEGKTQHWDKIAKLSFAEWQKEYITLNVPEERKKLSAYILYSQGMFWRIERDYTVSRYNLDGSYKDTLNLKSKFANSNVLNLYGTDSFIGYYSSGYNYNFLFKDYYNFFTGDDEYIYIGYVVKKTDKDNKVFYEYYLCSLNIDGNVVSETLISSVYSNYGAPYVCASASIVYINNQTYIISKAAQQKKIFKIENGVFKEKSSSLLKQLLNRSEILFYSKEGWLFTLGDGYSGNGSYRVRSLYAHILIPWSSHCKLSSPVTKTSTNTMKIQYDVTVDYIMPGMIENLK